MKKFLLVFCLLLGSLTIYAQEFSNDYYYPGQSFVGGMKGEYVEDYADEILDNHSPVIAGFTNKASFGIYYTF